MRTPAYWPGRFTIFFFNDTATTEIYTLSLHDALPISSRVSAVANGLRTSRPSEPSRACTWRAPATPRLTAWPPDSATNRPLLPARVRCRARSRADRIPARYVDRELRRQP